MRRLQQAHPGRAPVAATASASTSSKAGCSSRCRPALPPHAARLESAARALQAVSPLATLGRGFAVITRSADGALVTAAAQLRSARPSTRRWRTGSLHAAVLSGAHESAMRSALGWRPALIARPCAALRCAIGLPRPARCRAGSRCCRWPAERRRWRRRAAGQLRRRARHGAEAVRPLAGRRRHSAERRARRGRAGGPGVGRQSPARDTEVPDRTQALRGAAADGAALEGRSVEEGPGARQPRAGSSARRRSPASSSSRRPRCGCCRR